MSRVYYLHPSSTDWATHWVIPAGIFGLMNQLQQAGFQVCGLNQPMEIQLNPGFLLPNWLKANPAEYYLIDIHWFVHIKKAGEISKLIKEIHPKAKVIVGGLTASLFSKEILEYFSEIDFIISGDAEEPLILLLSALEAKTPLTEVPNLSYRLDQEIIQSKRIFTLRDFGKTSYVNLDFLIHGQEYLYRTIPGRCCDEKAFWLLTGRGCLYNCPCCGGASRNSEEVFGRGGFLARGLEYVLKDIEKLTHLGVDMVKLTHDLSALDEVIYEDFFHHYQQAHWEMRIYNEFWQIPTLGFLQQAVRYGLAQKLDLAITVHSGDEELRKIYGKFYSNQELINLLEYCIVHGFTVKLFFSRLVVEETQETLKKTLALIERLIKLDNGAKLITFCYEPLIVDPCSHMTDHQTKERLFIQYLNWNANQTDSLYEKCQKGSLTKKETLLDLKICELVQR